MKSIGKIFAFILLSSNFVNAQCTVIIPANTHIITNDTIIDCSFIPNHNFLICPGASLTMTGNSTCVNHFYMENGSVVTFNDTMPGAPYGMFTFYVRGIAILNYNDDSPGSFGFIDTLIYEPSTLLMDTGDVFHSIQMCPSITFDYSLLTTSSPCTTTSILSTGKEYEFTISPMPFNNYLNIEMDEVINATTIKVFNVLGEELEQFEFTSTKSQSLQIKNKWSGVGYLQLLEDGKVIGRKMIARTN